MKITILQDISSGFLGILNITFFQLEIHWADIFIKTWGNNPEFGLPVGLWDREKNVLSWIIALWVIPNGFFEGNIKYVQGVVLVSFLLDLNYFSRGTNECFQIQLAKRCLKLWKKTRLIWRIVLWVGSKVIIALAAQLLWPRPLSYRNQSIDLLSKSIDWFLYDNGLRHERVNVNGAYIRCLCT